ncbi:MAG: glycosyltransferase family 2 protein [Deltaproteobacteria bacterium]|nr:glycosyltransferase family 2 protein [Deltaproteobacteria bacterium]
MDLSVVIPCYEEGENIEALVDELDHMVETLVASGRTCEVILVDDGSRDATFELATALARDRAYLRIIRFRRNFGQTAAMSAGFAEASGRVIVPMDADRQNDPADVPRLLERLDEGFDVVSGWRRDRQDRWLTRKLPSHAANRLVSWVGGLKLHDYGCTLKAYRREVLEPVRLYGEMHRFIPIYAMWNGARVTEMPVNHRPRVAGRSKYNLGRTFKVLMDLVTLKFLGDYSTKPLYMFGGLGSLSCLAGSIFGIITLVQKYVSGAWVHKNPLLLLAVFLFIVGLLMIFMGLLAELLVRTYHESQGKPTYLIRERVNFDRTIAPSTPEGPMRSLDGVTDPSPHRSSAGSTDGPAEGQSGESTGGSIDLQNRRPADGSTNGLIKGKDES